jgi:hypothetical protein
MLKLLLVGAVVGVVLIGSISAVGVAGYVMGKASAGESEWVDIEDCVAVVVQHRVAAESTAKQACEAEMWLNGLSAREKAAIRQARTDLNIKFLEYDVSQDLFRLENDLRR